MSKYNADGTRDDLSDGKCAGTTNWILDTQPFRQWLDSDTPSCFALTGIVGSGKTKVTTTVVDYLEDAVSTPNNNRQVFHFFYRSAFRERLTGLDVFEAFLKQIIIRNPEMPADLQHRVWTYYGPESGRPHLGQLGKRLLLPLVEHLTKPIFVIDGLDECEPISRQELVQFIPLLVAKGSSVFVSTRDISELIRRFPYLATAECTIAEEGVRHDLEVFVSDMIERQPIITNDQEVLKLIKTTLICKAKAM
ncbi:hypothetical protein K461DRAFT_38542 [Myriangium duriaei CBS 260.36]|uniref:Nephrocystin 3-like N-terminal domain-containing protein n=1 Tax=Myriangium duriaei CBS 260.36 TaxID=1168546 RepID=A0A9P4IWV6_9PEZI|nr:hypothetical protein K461DRAFT_38542 [Myriangium duriaei CBS 260.36]